MKKLALLLLLPLLSACQALTSTEKPPTIYVLHAAPSGAAADATVERQAGGVLVVNDPLMPAGFDTDRIGLYLAGGHQLDYYAGAKWPVSLSRMLQDAVVQAGHQALPNMVIATPDLGVAANYKLSMTVIDFAPVYQGAATAVPLLRETLNFTLVKMPEQVIVADFTQTNEKPAANNTLPAVTMGLEELLQGHLQQAFAQIGNTISTDKTDTAKPAGP